MFWLCHMICGSPPQGLSIHQDRPKKFKVKDPVRHREAYLHAVLLAHTGEHSKNWFHLYRWKQDLYEKKRREERKINSDLLEPWTWVSCWVAGKEQRCQAVCSALRQLHGPSKKPSQFFVDSAGQLECFRFVLCLPLTPRERLLRPVPHTVCTGTSQQ